jgi:hypothetical protein
MVVAPEPGVYPTAGEVIPSPPSSDGETTTYTLEVFRTTGDVKDVVRDAPTIDIVRESGSVVNIGAGPNLPANPYEGQVWILT